jgi:hypothetical protein
MAPRKAFLKKEPRWCPESLSSSLKATLSQKRTSAVSLTSGVWFWRVSEGVGSEGRGEGGARGRGGGGGRDGGGGRERGWGLTLPSSFKDNPKASMYT